MEITSFDLRATLAERAFPSTTCRIHLSEKPFFELAALERKAADVAEDPAELGLLEKKIEEKEREIEDQAYVIHLRGISNRAAQDINSKALAAVPIKRDLYGREEDEATINRRDVLTELIFAAYMTKIVSPSGAEQVLDDDNRRDVARAFIDMAPRRSIQIVDQTIARLSGEAEMARLEAQEPDFSVGS